MTRRFGAVMAGLFVVCGASTAFAQDGKLKLGLRSGYAITAGHVSGAVTRGGVTLTAPTMSDQTTGQIPIWIDAGYQVHPNLMLGVYGEYGFDVGSPTNCWGCTAHDLRLGIQGQFHVNPDHGIDPWLGVGFGYESLALSQGGTDGTLSGWELLNLQGGVDFQAARAFTVGPFLSVALDEYTKASGGGQSLDFDAKAIHEWITIGVKGTFGI
jgi:hypothetical protein